MWKRVKAALFNWFFLLLFTGMSLFMILGMSTEFPKLFEENEEKIVEETFTSKGLYFGLQYYALLSDGAEHRILKGDFLQLEAGDRFKMFFNQSSFKDFMLFTTVTVLMLWLWLAITYLFAANIFGRTRWFAWIERKKQRLQDMISYPFTRSEKSLDWFKRVTMIVLIVALAILPLMMVKNIAYKVVPFGKTSTVAEIMHYEQDQTRSPRVVIDTYTLTYQYEDGAGASYITRKNVSPATYNMYKDRQLIPILYRNNLPYDTFIDHRSVWEYISPFISILTFFFALFSYAAYFLMKRYVAVWGMPFIRSR